MDSNLENKKLNINGRDINDEINLKDIFFTILRFKKIVFSLSLTGLLSGILLAHTTKRIWQGEFQIVLDSSKNRSERINIPLPGLADNESELLTEVEILKSPSVLFKIFEFVKSSKNLEDPSVASNMRFHSWRQDNLEIELTRKTSVLNITYEDNDKELILPVLNKISKEYQKYSSKKRLRAIELQNKFFTDQIKTYRKQSIASIRKAQEFAIENELTLLRDAEIDKEIPNAININAIRVNSSNIIRNADFQLSQLEKLGNDPDKLLYFGRLIEGLNETNLPSDLREIEDKLSFNRLIYTEEDDSIKSLLKKRKNKINIFKKQAILILKAQKSEAEQKLKLAERPKGTIVKYNEFIREAEKDKATLDKLETEYRLLLLERSKGKDPWNLITNPTVFDFPVAPRKKIYYLIGLIAGFSTGSLTSILLAKYQDLIYRENELKNFTLAKIIQSLPKNDQDSWIDRLDFVFSGVLSNKSGKILILASGEIQKRYIEKINEINNKFPDSLKFRVSSDYKDLSKFESVILLVELKVTKKEELKSLINFISISNLPLLGIIVIKEYI